MFAYYYHRVWACKRWSIPSHMFREISSCWRVLLYWYVSFLSKYMYVFRATAAAAGCRELQRRQTIRRDFFFLHLRCRIYLFSTQHSRSLRRRDARDIISAIRFSLLLLLLLLPLHRVLLLFVVVGAARSLRKTSLRRENHLHVAKHIGYPLASFSSSFSSSSSSSLPSSAFSRHFFSSSWRARNVQQQTVF